MLALRPFAVQDYIHGKLWSLLETTPEKPFILSDNPVAYVDETHEDGTRVGALDTWNPGLEVHMPLSPTISLTVRTVDHLYSALRASECIPELMRGLTLEEQQRAEPYNERTKALWLNLQTGTPVPCAHEELINSRTMQVLSSEQFLYSPQREVLQGHVIPLLEQHSEFRKGPRFEVDTLQAEVPEILRRIAESKGL